MFLSSGYFSISVGGLHSFAGDHGFQLQRVHSGFAFEVVVGDYVRRVGALGYAFDFFFPSCQFALVVEIVVEIVVAVVAVVGVGALIGKPLIGEPLIGEPMLVVAAVQADVAGSGASA